MDKKSIFKYLVEFVIYVVIAFIVFSIFEYFDKPAIATGNLVIKSSQYVGGSMCEYSVSEKHDSKLIDIFRFKHVCGVHSPGDNILLTKGLPDAEPINAKKGKKK